MQGIAELLDQLAPAPEAGNLGVRTRSVTVDLPVEVRVQPNATGALTLDASPPTQPFRTSFMPVLHRVHLRLEVAEEP